MRRRTVTLLAAFLLLSLIPAVAHADDVSRAASLFKEGNELRKAGKYASALARYQAAYKLLPSFKIDYNIALTLEKVGQKARAADAYERFLVTGEGKSPARMLKRARRKLKALRRKVATVQIEHSGAAGAAVKVDGVGRGVIPLPWPLYLEPGKHRVEVVKEGHEPFTVELTLRRAQRRTLTVTLTPRVAKPEAPVPVPAKPPVEPKVAPSPERPEPVEPMETPPPEQTAVHPPGPGAVPADAGRDAQDGDSLLLKKRRGKTIWAWTSLGVGLACAVGAGVMYGVGSSQSNAAYNRYSGLADTESADTFDTHWSEVESAERLYIGGHVLAGVAAVAVGVAIYQLATRPAEESSAARSGQGMRLGMTADGHGAGLVLSGGF